MFGIIELPVENASATRTKPNAGFDHHVISSASRLRWTIPSATAADRLDHEIAVRDRIERVRADAIEAELHRGRLTIERISGARQRPRPERRDVDPFPGIGQPAAVALGHLDIGEQVMGEQDRLCRLDVGRARQHGRPVALGEGDERPFEVEQGEEEIVDRPARPQSKVGGDLVVARSTRMESAGERPDLPGQRRLDVHVDVLERPVPLEPARSEVLRERRQPIDECLHVVRAQDAGATEAPHVGDRTRDVVSGEGGVDLDRAGEVRHARIRLAAEPPAPGPHRPSVVRCPCYPAPRAARRLTCY